MVSRLPACRHRTSVRHGDPSRVSRSSMTSIKARTVSNDLRDLIGTAQIALIEGRVTRAPCGSGTPRASDRRRTCAAPGQPSPVRTEVGRR
jgi:hypothetical protein